MRLQLSKIFPLFLFLFLWISALPSLAQEKTTISLEEAIKKGIENSYNMKAAGARLEITKTKSEEVHDLALPTIKAYASYTRLSDIEPFKISLSPNSEPVTLFPVILNDYSSRVSLYQPVFTGFKMKNAMIAGEANIKASEEDLNKERSEVILSVIRTYMDVYKLRSSADAVKESINRASEQLKEIESKENAGTVTHNDVLRSRVFKDNLELNLLELKGNLESAYYNLKTLLGVPVTSAINIDSTVANFPAEARSLQVLLDQAVTRSDIRSLENRKKASEANVSVSKGNFYPQIGIGSNYYFMRPNPRFMPPKDEFKGSWDIGITASIDISALYTNKKQVREAEANVSVLDAQYNMALEAARMEINRAYISYAQALKKVELSEKIIVQAEENLRLMRSRYTNEVALMTDLLDAQQSLLQAKVTLANNKAEAVDAIARLKKATGELN